MLLKRSPGSLGQDLCGHVQLARTRMLEKTSSAYSEVGGSGVGAAF